MPDARAFLRKFLELQDELRFFPRRAGAGERIILASKVAGLTHEFGLYVEDHDYSGRNHGVMAETLASLKKSLKLANSGEMKMAASMMGEAARFLARLVVITAAEKGKSGEKDRNG